MNTQVLMSTVRVALTIATLVVTNGCAAPQLQSSPGVRSSEAELSPWTYPEGPSWGPGCETPPPVFQQSPIDFTKLPPTPKPGAPQPVSAQVVLQGTFDPHDQNVVFVPAISINPAPGATTQATYAAIGFHFHSHAEHVVSGAAESLEIHIKTTYLSSTAVFSIIWTVNNSAPGDPTLAAVPQAITNHTGVDLGPALSNFVQRPFYSYMGSLTTPPCTTRILWYVLQTPIGATQTQLRSAMLALIDAGLPSEGTYPNLRGINFRATKTLIIPPPTVYLVTPIPQPRRTSTAK